MKFSTVLCCALLMAVVLLLGSTSASEPCDPQHCRDDAYCPQYFKGICGTYNGDYMVFAGDCYMDNHSCRTCTEYVKVDDTLCQKNKNKS